MNGRGVGASARTRPLYFLSISAPPYWLALPIICLAVYWRGLTCLLAVLVCTALLGGVGSALDRGPRTGRVVTPSSSCEGLR